MTESYDDIDFGEPNPVIVPAVWTMTDAEFDEELRKAKESAWDEGALAVMGAHDIGWVDLANPYGSRK